MKLKSMKHQLQIATNSGTKKCIFESTNGVQLINTSVLLVYYLLHASKLVCFSSFSFRMRFKNCTLVAALGQDVGLKIQLHD